MAKKPRNRRNRRQKAARTEDDQQNMPNQAPQNASNIVSPIPRTLPPQEGGAGKSSTRNESNTPQTIRFLDLAGEIRNKIYHHALVADSPMDLWAVWGSKKAYVDRASDPVHEILYRRTRRSYTARIASNLARTCRAVHAEANPILYGQNAFRFTDVKAWVLLDLWLAMIGPRNRALVRDLSVALPYRYGALLGKTEHYQWDARLRYVARVWGMTDRLEQVNLDREDRHKPQYWSGINENEFYYSAVVMLADLERLERFAYVLQYGFDVYHHAEKDLDRLHKIVSYVGRGEDKEMALVVLTRAFRTPLSVGERDWMMKSDDRMGRAAVVKCFTEWGWDVLVAKCRPKDTYVMAGPFKLGRVYS